MAGEWSVKRGAWSVKETIRRRRRKEADHSGTPLFHSAMNHLGRGTIAELINSAMVPRNGFMAAVRVQNWSFA